MHSEELGTRGDFQHLEVTGHRTAATELEMVMNELAGIENISNISLVVREISGTIIHAILGSGNNVNVTLAAGLSPLAGAASMPPCDIVEGAGSCSTRAARTLSG